MEGRVVITPDGGESYTVSAGEAFCIESDFAGTWKIEEPVRKHFFIKLKCSHCSKGDALLGYFKNQQQRYYLSIS